MLILRWSGILLGILFIAAALSACEDGSTPDKGTAKSISDTQAPDSSRMSLDDYLTICSGPTPGQTDAEFTSLAGFAAVLGEFTEQLEAVEPPEEVADWHDAVLVYQRAVKEALDDAPGPGEGESEDMYILGVLFPVGLQHQPAISDAIEGMDRELVARMVEAGCIDEDILSMSLTEEELKELGVGAGGTAGGRMITEFASISAGSDHTCGVGTDGYVGCWGRGSDFLGKASPPDGEFSFVAAGWIHTCGVRADGSVACWGDDSWGQATPPEGEFTSVSVGSTHSCGVRTDGSVACWGDDDDGEASPPAGQFISISAGDNHTCGIRADASVACWGDGFDGQATPPEGGFVSLSVNYHTCAVRTDGSVACWRDGYGGLPLSERPPEGDFISVSVGITHSCGVRTDGSVACWGSDHLGQSSPPEGEFVSVSAGDYHTCGIKADASVACWGSDDDGESSPPVAP